MEIQRAESDPIWRYVSFSSEVRSGFLARPHHERRRASSQLPDQRRTTVPIAVGRGRHIRIGTFQITLANPEADLIPRQPRRDRNKTPRKALGNEQNRERSDRSGWSKKPLNVYPVATLPVPFWMLVAESLPGLLRSRYSASTTTPFPPFNNVFSLNPTSSIFQVS